MLNENCSKFVCVLTIIGLTAAGTDLVKPKNATRALRTNYLQEIRPFWWRQQYCIGQSNGWFAHPDSCTMWISCLGGIFGEGSCDIIEGVQLEFNHLISACQPPGSFECQTEFPTFTSTPSPEDPGVDNGCPPPGSDQLVFIESEFCDEFYICINGQRIIQQCRDGLHFNPTTNQCDFPENAGCEFDIPRSLPTCDDVTVIGQFPHPTECSMFIHCNNGNRSIQHCPHLFFFDENMSRCVFWTVATCTAG